MHALVDVQYSKGIGLYKGGVLTREGGWVMPEKVENTLCR